MRIIALLAVLACAAAGESGPPDLLRDGGFEAWNAGGPAAWTAWGENILVTPAASPAAGAHAVRFGHRDPATVAVLRQGPIEALAPGGAYELSFLARSDIPDQGLSVIAYADPHAGSHWYRTTDLRLGAEWRRYRVPIRLPDAAGFRPVAIHFWIRGGQVELDDASLRATVPSGGETVAERVNRFDDPGFDLGGRSWRYFPWYQATDALPDYDEQVFHDGRRSIRFPGKGESVESRLYALPTGRPWTVSAWVRGGAGSGAADGDAFHMYLIQAAWRLQSLQVSRGQLSGDWQRFSITWTPPPHDDPYGASVYLRFDACMPLWLDALQLEEGTQATAYQPGPQIGLACDRPGLVAAPGPLALTLRAVQPVAGPAVAEVEAGDARGRELWSTRLDLGQVGPDGIAVPVAASLPRLGVAELRARLRSGDGRLLANAALRVAAADPAQQIRANPLIGIDNNPFMHLAPRLREREDCSTLLGSGCTRVFFSCTNGDRKALAQDGPEFLAIARALLDPGMQHGRPVTTCIEPADDAPLNLGWMQRQGRGPTEAEEAPAISAYAARVARIVAGGRGRIACYELLNEPNIWWIKGQRVMPAERLARIIAGVAPALRAADPAARIAANINGIDLPYVETLLSQPGAAAIDVLTVHPYRANPELPPLYEDMRALRALADRLRPGLRIEATEQYFLSREDGFANGEYDRNYAAQTESDQAGRSIQAALHHLAAEATPYVFFQPEDNLYRQAPQGTHWFFAATMLRQLSQTLIGLESGMTLEAHPSCRAFLYRLHGGGRVVAVMAREYGLHGRLVLPAGCTASDCDGNLIAGPEAVIDHLPTWLAFPPGTADAAIAQALRQAGWLGFDFPLAAQAADAGDHLDIAVANHGTSAAGGTVELVAAPPGWPTGRIEVPQLAPGAVHRAALSGLPGPLAWDADGAVRWRLVSGGEVAVRAARVPTLRIPRIAAGWPGNAWIALDERHVSKDFAEGRLPHAGSGDLSARIALGWDADGLRLEAEVRDDVVQRGDVPDDLLWQQDSLQLYLDPADAAQEGRRGFNRGDACWLFGPARAGGTAALLTHNPGDRYLGAANAETGPDPEVRAAWMRRPDGWALSLRLPPRVLPGLRLQAGARLGCSLLINDNDGQGRKAGLTLGRAGSEPYEQPWIWRCAVLAE